MGVAEVVMVEESLPNQGAVGSLVVVVVVMVVVVMEVEMVVVVMEVEMVVASSLPQLQEVAMGFPVVGVTQVV